VTTTPGKERRNRRWRRRHLVTAVVSFVVICAAAYAVVVWHTYQNTKPAVDAANTFLNSIETGNVTDAYDQLCAPTRKQFSATQFSAYVKSQPGIAGHASTSVDMSTVDGVDSAIVTENITTTSGSSQSRSIVVDHEDGAWLVCGQPY